MRILFFFVLLALLAPMVAEAQEPEPYAVYDEGAKTFTFYYDSERASRSGTSYDLTPDENGYPQWLNAEWNWSGPVTKAVFDASFADARPTSTRLWFIYFGKMTDIEGMEYLNTSEVTNMGSMFLGCSSLKSLDLSHFNTDNVTNMNSMFTGCSSLTSLDVSHFNTDNVTNMKGLFAGCSSLTSLDVSRFNTDNVTNMIGLFSGCSNLTSLDLSNFNTDNVTSMEEMFADCSGLKSLDLSNFKTNNVTDMYGMFSDCSGLVTIYCNDNWNADGRDGENMFVGCTSLVGGVGTAYDETRTDATMAHPDAKSNPGYFTLAKSWAEGDLTHDGKVDAADVVVLVALMMNPDSGSLDEGDLNHDGVVNAADVIRLTNLITQ